MITGAPMKQYDEWQALMGAQTQHDLPYQIQQARTTRMFAFSG